MLYRSPLTRWLLTLVAVWAGLMLAFGGAKWQTTPSLLWLTQTDIPLLVWGLAIVAYGLLLIPVRTRYLGFALGGVLYGVFTVALIATIAGADPRNSVAIAGLIDVVIFHFYSVRTAQQVRNDRYPPPCT